MLQVPAEETFQLQDSDGHVFCFLPLSLEQKTPTGLPVHVNGFFALEQNRKYLKWAGTYRTREELMDKRLLWNQCLLREAIPRAYVHLLLAAIRLHQAGGAAPHISTDAIYRAFPSFHCVDRKWEVILLPLFTELFKHEVVHTSGTQARWIMAKDAIFNTLENSHGSQDIILEVHTINKQHSSKCTVANLANASEKLTFATKKTRGK
jgi:sacsin